MERTGAKLEREGRMNSKFQDHFWVSRRERGRKEGKNRNEAGRKAGWEGGRGRREREREGRISLCNGGHHTQLSNLS